MTKLLTNRPSGQKVSVLNGYKRNYSLRLKKNSLIGFKKDTPHLLGVFYQSEIKITPFDILSPNSRVVSAKPRLATSNLINEKIIKARCFLKRSFPKDPNCLHVCVWIFHHVDHFTVVAHFQTTS